MASYESSMDEKSFADSLERTLHIIKSGVKVGVDNLELILDTNSNYDLGPMVDILNKCEIEYKQGKGGKFFSLNKMLSAYHDGRKEGLRKLLDKCKEIESLRGAYMNAEGWLNLLNFGRSGEATPPTDEEMFIEAVKYFAGLKDDNKIPETIYAAHFSDDPADNIPPSNTKARYFCSNKEIGDLNDRLEYEIHQKGKKNNVREEHRKDLFKLKEIAGDKYAYTRAEILGMLDLYKGYQVPVGSE